MAKGKSRPLVIVLGIILVLVVLFAGCLGLSAARISGLVEQANGQYQAYESCANKGDLAGAKTQVFALAETLDTIEAETSAWQWQAASGLPVLGEDVRCAQGLANIADDLANEALVPVLTELDDIFGGFSDGGVLDLNAWGDLFLTKGKKIGELFDDIADAREIVRQCRNEADALPTSHFDQVNEAADNVREAMVNLDEFFGIYDDIAGLFG